VSADTDPDNVITAGFSGTDNSMTARRRTICVSQQKIRVTHDNGPSSAVSRLFKVKVNNKKLTKQTFSQVIYRCAMDEEIHPTITQIVFSEFVIIKCTRTSNYDSSNDNGLCPP
jgi:hypothetical protein